MEGSAPRGLRRDTDKNPASHVIRGDGGSLPESPRRGGEDPKHTHMWLTLIITHTHTHSSRGCGKVYCSHNTALCGEQGSLSDLLIAGHQAQEGFGRQQGLGLVVFR